MVEIMRTSRGGMAAYISDQRDEIVRVICACSDMEQFRSALVTVTSIRQILGEISLDAAEAAVIRKTDYEDYEIVEFACKQFRHLTGYYLYYEEYRRNPSGPRWDALPHLRAFVTSTANTRRESAGDATGPAFAVRQQPCSGRRRRT